MKRMFGVSVLIMLMLATSYISIATSSTGNLCYSPKSYDFGYKRPGEKDSTNLEIWACCGCVGSITYTLHENCSWVEVNPTSGYSSGEKDTITVRIDTTGLPEGSYSCPIWIRSNSGDGLFTVKVKVADDHTPPTVKIVKPERGWIYVNNKKTLHIGFATIIIGNIDVEVEASDDKSEIEKVEIYLGNELVKTDPMKPYSWSWIGPSFGKFVIKAKVYDSFMQSSVDILSVWRFF